jgi:hypothetical protein
MFIYVQVQGLKVPMTYGTMADIHESESSLNESLSTVQAAEQYKKRYVYSNKELSAPHCGCFTPWKHLIPIVQKTGWAPGTVWMGVENFIPTGFQSLICPTSRKSLY